jgi:hypothetical protein
MYTILDGHERIRPLVAPRLRTGNNIEIELRYIKMLGFRLEFSVFGSDTVAGFCTNGTECSGFHIGRGI